MKLIFTNEKRSIDLPSGCRLVIGRQEDADIRIPDKHVSRRHAEITEEDGKVFVRDLGSHAGTKKNGVGVTDKTELAEGDILKIADFEFTVSSSSAATVNSMPVTPQQNAARQAVPPDSREIPAGAGT